MTQLLILLLCGLLTACSGNPMNNKPVNKTARLLSSASGLAMQRLHPEVSSKSDYYRLCMENQTPDSFNCRALYQAMAETLCKQGIQVNVMHLQDKQLYAHLREELQVLSYFSL